MTERERNATDVAANRRKKKHHYIYKEKESVTYRTQLIYRQCPREDDLGRRRRPRGTPQMALTVVTFNTASFLRMKNTTRDRDIWLRRQGLALRNR